MREGEGIVWQLDVSSDLLDDECRWNDKARCLGEEGDKF